MPGERGNRFLHPGRGESAALPAAVARTQREPDSSPRRRHQANEGYTTQVVLTARSFSTLSAALAALALPAAAVAGDTAGGTAAPPAPTSPSNPAETPVDTPAVAFVHQRVVISGKARRARRKVVHVERRSGRGAWVLVRNARADRLGKWRVGWKPRRSGAYELRARIGRSSGGNGGTSWSGGIQVDAAASNVLAVYEPAIATWYGPGFFGKQTACGIDLEPETLGVAHRDLPCGTQVQITYAGRTIVVPVIDRGPFANNADWDLTQAAAQQLGMTATSRIGAMALTPDG